MPASSLLTIFLTLLCLSLALSWLPACASAQEGGGDESATAAESDADSTSSLGKWPSYKFTGPHTADRGPGGYLSWWKLALLWTLFLLWVKTTDWISRDCQAHKLPYALWNLVAFLPFPLTVVIISLTVPYFAVGLPAALIGLFAPLLTYVFKRNAIVEPHEMVLTRDHIKHMFTEFLRKGGAEIGEQKSGHEAGAPVTFQPLGGDEDKRQALLVKCRQSEGYLTAKDIVANALNHHADKLMLDYSPEAVTVRYQVDGVWHDADAQEREEGDLALGVLKSLAWLKTEERRARQEGKFDLALSGVKYGCTLVSQGTKTGERILLQFVGRKTTYKTLEELGMRDKMIEQFKGVMLTEHGFIIISSMPGGGLSTTLNVALRTTDRLLRDFVVLEDVANKMEEVENVDPTRYNLAAGETPDALLPSLLRKEPNVLVVPDLPNAETVEILCDAAAQDQLVFTTIRAKEAVESLLRVLLLKVPAKKFAPVAVAVLNERLVRKLCETCREEYEPPPALLQKMGIPAGRVERLYRHPEAPEEVCPDCHGIGYRGRTAIYELLIVNDAIRDALVKQPKLEVLRDVARRSGHRTLQAEGIVTVVKGVTSIAELMRVLKQ